MKKIITHLSLAAILVTLLAAASSRAATTFQITPTGTVTFNTHAGVQTTQQIMITNYTVNPLSLTLTSTNPLFGVSGLPTVTVGAEGTATVTLTYAPNLNASDTGTLYVASTDSTAAVKLSGNSLANPMFQIVPSGTITFNTQAGAQTMDTVTITNLTAGPIVISTSTSGNSAFGISGLKTFTVGTLATSKVVLTFNPTVAGTDSGTFTVASILDTVRSKLLGIASAVSLPKIQLIPSGDIVLTTTAGVKATQQIQVKNISDSAANVSVSTTGSGLFSISGPATFNLAAGATHNVTVAYTPLVSGTDTGTLVVNGGAAGTVTSKLVGHANLPGSGKLTVANEVDYNAMLGTTQCLPITLANALGSAVTVSNVMITGGGGEFTTSNNGSFQVGNDSNSTITVCFTPTTASGVVNGVLSFSFMSPDSLLSGTQTVNLEGHITSHGLPGDSLFFSVTKNLEFNDVMVGTTSCQTIQVTNPTTQIVVIDSAMVSGANAASFTTSGATMLQVPPSSTEYINVCFSPTVNANDQNATITLPYSISGTNLTGNLTVHVEGNTLDTTSGSISNCIQIRRENGVIGPIIVGGSSTGNILVTNRTTGAVTVNGATFSSNDSGAFSIASTQFPMTIQAGQTGVLNVMFNPTGLSGSPSFGGTVNLNVTGASMNCGPVSFHIEGVAVPGNNGRDTNHINLGLGLTGNGTNVIAIINRTSAPCVVDTVTLDNTTGSTITVTNPFIPSNPNLQVIGSSMTFPATISAGSSVQVYVQFCNANQMNTTFDAPLLVQTSQSITPETFTIQAVALAPAAVAGAPASSSDLVKLSPNPASDETNIQITLDNSSMLELSLYDAAGHFIRNIFSGRKEAGTFIQTFDAKSLPSGAYFIQARINGNLVQTKLDVVK